MTYDYVFLGSPGKKEGAESKVVQSAGPPFGRNRYGQEINVCIKELASSPDDIKMPPANTARQFSPRIARFVPRQSIRLTCGGLNRQQVYTDRVHASGRDDVVNGFQEWSPAPPSPGQTLAGSISRLHLRLPCHADRRFADRQSLSDYYACPPRLYDRCGHAGMPASLAVRCSA
ncbi:hypothetical protein EAG_05037 [Camponotus floridanus]|uniref:Uncharacterized protein n=1 Tax=Camponotus floridanus TaxID=104421 RepID=E2AK21_CAMFO|nr:hypothetical protein EAG_05037 [Camponotus floridanus]